MNKFGDAGAMFFSVGLNPANCACVAFFEGVKMDKEPKVIFSDPNTGVGQGAIESSWSIINEGERVGVFWFDDETQKFAFKGDLDLSAEIFMAAVLAKMNEGR